MHGVPRGGPVFRNFEPVRGLPRTAVLPQQRLHRRLRQLPLYERVAPGELQRASPVSDEPRRRRRQLLDLPSLLADLLQLHGMPRAQRGQDAGQAQGSAWLLDGGVLELPPRREQRRRRGRLTLSVSPRKVSGRAYRPAVLLVSRRQSASCGGRGRFPTPASLSISTPSPPHSTIQKAVSRRRGGWGVRLKTVVVQTASGGDAREAAGSAGTG